MHRKTLGEWKVRCIVKHGVSNYDYSILTEPNVSSRNVVTVNCLKHGPFSVVLGSHSTGKGVCQKCAKRKTYDRQEYINRATVIHNGAYSYSLWPSNVRMRTKVVSICPIHGEWSHTVTDHINSKTKCIECAKESHGEWAINDKSILLQRANRRHNSVYDYRSWPDQCSLKTKVVSICSSHGPWVHSVDNHIFQGTGCPGCFGRGFNVSHTGHLYFLCNNKGYVKIGISNNYENRINKLRNSTPFPFKTLAVFKNHSGLEVARLEKELHDVYPSAGLRGFDGATEWRVVESLDVLLLPEIFGFERLV